MFIAVKAKIAIMLVPAASPSMPSAKLTPFAAPAITKKTSPYQSQSSGSSTSAIGT
jgi:hypothetical protein